MEGNILYNIILGRQLIHDMEVDPSTLHRCIKFDNKDKTIKIDVDEE